MGALDHVALFESKRRFLLGLAYRLLGSYADAEDAVQDTFLKWRDEPTRLSRRLQLLRGWSDEDISEIFP